SKSSHPASPAATETACEPRKCPSRQQLSGSRALRRRRRRSEPKRLSATTPSAYSRLSSRQTAHTDGGPSRRCPYGERTLAASRTTIRARRYVFATCGRLAFLVDLSPTAVNTLLAEIRTLQSEGRTIVSLMRGEPDFDTPPHIVE